MFFEYGKQYWYLGYNWPTLQRGLSAIPELLVLRCPGTSFTWVFSLFPAFSKFSNHLQVMTYMSSLLLWIVLLRFRLIAIQFDGPQCTRPNVDVAKILQQKMVKRCICFLFTYMACTARVNLHRHILFTHRIYTLITLYQPVYFVFCPMFFITELFSCNLTPLQTADC